MGTVAHATAAPRHTPAPLPSEPRSRRRRTAPGQTQGAHPRPQHLQTRTFQRIRDAGGGGAEKGMYRGGEEGRGQSRREDLENKARNHHCQPAWAHQKPRCWAPCREGAAHTKAYQEARVSSTHANTRRQGGKQRALYHSRVCRRGCTFRLDISNFQGSRTKEIDAKLTLHNSVHTLSTTNTVALSRPLTWTGDPAETGTDTTASTC